MLKERYEKAKKFVKEYKYEIGIGCVLTACTVLGCKVGIEHMKKMNIKLENDKIFADAERLYIQAYNKATDIANDVLIPTINEKYKDYDFNLTDDVSQKMYAQYLGEYQIEWEKLLNEQLDKIK